MFFRVYLCPTRSYTRRQVTFQDSTWVSSRTCPCDSPGTLGGQYLVLVVECAKEAVGEPPKSREKAKADGCNSSKKESRRERIRARVMCVCLELYIGSFIDRLPTVKNKNIRPNKHVPMVQNKWEKGGIRMCLFN